jgi:photosystem II stability/assembly factor-like uncharacterized protein
MLRTKILILALTFSSVFSTSPLLAAEHPLSGIPLRSIGPALTSGRVADFAFVPGQSQKFYVAMASGGVWKTINNGITWKPVFDNEGSFAIGVVELDPSNPDIVWVGTGENNSQRSVGYGDGVYKSMDGGKTWKNMGLKESEHISQIRFHPADSDIVYVAAQGPLWSSGGDRGLYRSTNAGEDWERILDIDEHTGINEFVIDPANPDVIVASSYQRRRHVWTLLHGGPGGGIHKTTDGGNSWRKISNGLPGGDLARIGLAAAPSSPNIIYAMIGADEKDKGVYRSTDFGESWEKRSNRTAGSGQYYHELFVDPHNPERIYSVETFSAMSEDGGKTWEGVPFKNRHVDDHALWIDPDNTEHLYIGGELWRHVRNLPTVQYYRATPDNDYPFYNVCAGTQDNFTQCGPSRNTYTDGITNVDWWIAQFGDGFKAQIDPTDANVVYAQYQHGGLARFDRITGQRLIITPMPESGQKNYNWNWNSPLIISPHNSSRLYFGSERLHRSDDRGESWVEVSGDLSRDIDRNTFEIMGRVWSVDAISKNASTSIYGSLIAVDESPVIEGLIYAGTDDGLIHVTSDGGQNWRTVDSFRDVPDMSLIEDIIASHHDADVAYATIDNHKRGDFKPYVLKTTDRGRSWSLISNDLPERGTAHTIIEDHVDPSLLFVGTEFGVFFSNDGGEGWTELTTLPTVAVRDLEIQRREGDLVVGTFGRGIYILDDYSALRFSGDDLKDGPTMFSVRDSWLFIPDDRRGWGGKGDWGTGRYTADNPPYGAVFSYYLPEALQSMKEKRRAEEKERQKEGGDNPYPSWDQLRREDNEEAPSITLTVRDEAGNVVRRVNGPVKKGYHRVAWDMRYPAPDPVNLSPRTDFAPWQSPPQGPLATPGNYSVSMSQRLDGVSSEIGEPQTFALKSLYEGGLVTSDHQGLLEFEMQSGALYRAVTGADSAADEIQSRINHLLKAVNETPASSEDQAQALRELNARMAAFQIKLNGDRSVASRFEPVPLSINDRIGTILYASWNSQSAPTGNHRDSYAIAEAEFREALVDLKAISADLATVEAGLQNAGAPWTPGRIPEWP